MVMFGNSGLLIHMVHIGMQISRGVPGVIEHVVLAILMHQVLVSGRLWSAVG